MAQPLGRAMSTLGKRGKRAPHTQTPPWSSWALARGTSLTDICRVAGWANPNTLARFYKLRVEPVSSCVLTLNG